MAKKKDHPRQDAQSTPATTLADRFDVRIGDGMERYGRSPVVRTVVATLAALLVVDPMLAAYVPLIGALDVCLTGGAQRVAETRARQFAESLAREFSVVRAEMIRHDFFETTDGVDVLMRALQSAVRAKSDRQRDAVARVVVSAATGNVPPAVEPESLLAVLSEMSENEAVVLGILWREVEGNQQMPPYFNWEEELLPSAIAPQGEFLLRRLVARGLLSEHSSGRSVSKWGTSSEVVIDQEVGFTATGAALVRYLEENPPAPPS
jgi:hypothetical protein